MWIEFIGDRRQGLLFQTRTGKPLSQSHILRRHLHPAFEGAGFEKAGAHSFRRYRNTFLRNFTSWRAFATSGGLGCGDMSGHYDGIKNDIAFRKDLAQSCGVGFEVPVFLGSIEPNEPKIKGGVAQEVAVTI